MKRFKVFGFLFVLGMIFSLALVGCSSDDTEISDDSNNGNGNNTSGEVVKLTFWDENAGPARTPIWEELISRFEDEHKNIDIEYVGYPTGSSKEKYNAAIAAEDTPDVGSVQSSWLPEFSINNALLPLDEYFEGWDQKDKINPTTINFNKDIVQDGKLYGIPYTQNLDILWYREDWFADAGVEPPTTWEDFFTSVEEMTNKDEGHYGFTIRGGAGGSFQLQRMMYAYSGIGTYFDEDGNATINNPKHKEFLEKYLGMYNKYTPQSDITNGYKEMIAGFDTGKVALVQHNIGSFGEHSEALEQDQFEALPLPKSVDDTYVAEGGNTIGITIFKTTEHPDEAWEFVKFLTSAESQSYWNENVGQIPTHADVLDDEWVQNSQHIKTAFNVYESDDLVVYNPPFYLPDYRSILNNVVDPGIQEVMSGDITIDEFLEKWATAMEESNQKYQDTFNK